MVKKATVSNDIAYNWKETEQAIAVIKAEERSAPIEIKQITLVNTGFFTDKAESNKTNKTSSPIAKQTGEESVLNILAATSTKTIETTEIKTPIIDKTISSNTFFLNSIIIPPCY